VRVFLFLFNIIIWVGEHYKDKIDKIALRINLALFEFENVLSIELLQKLKKTNSTPLLEYHSVINWLLESHFEAIVALS
jgi:hypothetical protein